MDQNLTRFCQIVLPIANNVTQIETRKKVDETQHTVKQIGEVAGETSSGVKKIQEGVRNIDTNVGKLVDEKNRQRRSTDIPSVDPYGLPQPPEHTVGLEKPLKELRKKLLEPGSSVVGLSAPGGYGKTTLVKKLCQDKEIKGKFKDNILFVTVSNPSNLKLNVKRLLQQKGYPDVPEFQSVEETTYHLEQLLKKIGEKPTLLILDDVWHGSDSPIYKFINFQVPDCKVVVTSRSTFPILDSTYKLDTLNEIASLYLFRKEAFLDDNGSQSIDDDLVRKVVRACKGFPLALNMVSRKLCKQPSAVWRQTLEEWLKGSSIFDHNPELLNRLKTSLDALDNKPRVKECYMDLGSFPEGQRIPAAALIDMWAELYGMDEHGPEFMANIHEMSSFNLAELETTRKDVREDDGYYNDHFVTQHDLLKELVNYLSRMDPIKLRKRLIVRIGGNEFPEWMKQNEQPTSARLISISTDESFSSNWCNMSAPEAKVVILNFRAASYRLPHFITRMGKLKALIITNYGSSPAQISNFELVCKLASVNRIRLELVEVPSLTLGCATLHKMQKISLHKCDFGKEFGNLTSNALSNLVEVNISYPNNLVALPIGLFDILSLKKLCITYSQELSSLPEEIRKLANLQVLRLSSCTQLPELPDTIRNLQRLRILDLSDCTSISKLPEQIGELKSLRKLYMTRCSNCMLPKSFTRLVDLKEVICDEFEHVTKIVHSSC